MSFVKSEKSEKIKKLNIIIEQNQSILAQLEKQAQVLEKQTQDLAKQTHVLAKQAQDIQILKEENIKIIENSEKVGKHIDFVNRAYDKIANSYFGKHIFN